MTCPGSPSKLVVDLGTESKTFYSDCSNCCITLRHPPSLNFLNHKKRSRGQPCGPLKFGTLHFGSLGSVPWHGPAPLISGHAVAVTHIQNRGILVQVVAQGQSSSAKKRERENQMGWRYELNKSTHVKGFLSCKAQPGHSSVFSLLLL